MPSADPGAACAHCGLTVPAGLIDAAANEQFCCAGCRSARTLLRGCDLDGYYRLRSQAGGAGNPGGDAEAEAAAATAAGGEAFLRTHLRPLPGGLAAMRWHCGGMHCAACVWLLERLPHLDPGIRSARVAYAAGTVDIIADPAACPPARQAALLVRLGYRPRPDDGGDSALRGERRDLLLRLVVAAACAVGSMHLSVNLYAGQHTDDLDAGGKALFAALAVAVALPAATWAAAPIWRAAWASLRQRSLGVDAAAALAIAVAAIASGINLARGSQEIYADAVAMFVGLLLLGRLAVVEARIAANRARSGLAALLPPTARRRQGPGWVEVPAGELVAGDCIEVRADECLAADGVVDGTGGAVDNAVLTGESRPVAVAAGDAVFAGATCRTGPLTVRVTAVGPGTRVGRLLADVTAAAGAPRRRRRTADAVQAWIVPLTLAAAVVVGAMWWWLSGPERGLAQAVAVILVTCPCALGLAAPLVQAATIGRLAAAGILVRDGDAVDELASGRLRHAVLDKTGTLTRGRAVATADRPLNDSDRALIHAVAARSGHPVAAAIATATAVTGDDASASVLAVRTMPGRGLDADTTAGRMLLGNARHVGLPEDGRTWAVLDGRPLAAFAIDDPPSPSAPALLDRLRGRGLDLHIASGDAPTITRAVGAQLGIEAGHVHGGLEPEDKAALVRSLGDGVLVVGDGVNDAAALASAEVAVGVRGGIAAALPACHIYIARPDAIAGLGDLLDAADRSRRRVRLLVTLALVYNAAGIALAAAGVWGPYLCAVAMPLSSIVSVVVAMRR